jgi:hypothetical protein
MSLQSRIESLKDRHQALELRLSDEGNRPKPDREAQLQLKHQKLRLKDEMERLASSR